MRILRATITSTGTQATANWQTDEPTTAVIQYGVPGGALTDVVVADALYQHSDIISPLTPGVIYRARILCTSSLTSAVANTDWFTLTGYTVAATVDPAPAPTIDLVPACTSLGSAIAAQFPEWSSVNTGLDLELALAATSGSHALRAGSLADLDGLVYGHLLRPATARKPLYTVANQPGLPTVVAVPTLTTLVLDPWPDWFSVDDVGAVIYAADDPDTHYHIAGYDENAQTITLDAATAITTASVWYIVAPVVQVDTAVTADDANETLWVATTLGRRIIEALARRFEQASATLEDNDPYAISRRSTHIAWHGHICTVPDWNPAIPADAIDIARTVATTPASNTTAPSLVRVNSAVDLLTLPAPCYYIVNGVALFHNLTLTEEQITPDVTDGVESLTTSLPIVPGTTIWITRSPHALSGWQAFGPDDYTVSADVTGDTVTLGIATGYDELLVRYQVAKSHADPYGTHVRVAVCGREMLPVTHLLWNRFDDVGTLLGCPRRWETTQPAYYESNVQYQERLIVSAAVAPLPLHDNVLMRTATNVGACTRQVWNPAYTPTLTVPADTTEVHIPGYPWKYTLDASLQLAGDWYIAPGGTIAGYTPDGRELLPEVMTTVTVTVDTGTVSAELADAPAAGSTILYRTRADRDWRILPAVWDYTSGTLSWDDADADGILAESPVTFAYASTAGSVGIPPFRVLASPIERFQDAPLTATCVICQWQLRDGVLYNYGKTPTALTVFSAQGVSLTPLVALDLTDNDTGFPTDAAWQYQEELSKRIPAVVGYGARWDNVRWYGPLDTPPAIGHLTTPWVTLL